MLYIRSLILLNIIFSSPEQRSKRDIVLPSASAAASALVLALGSESTNVKFSLKIL